MSAILAAFDRWGPRAVTAGTIALVLLLLLAALVLSVVHASVSAVTLAGAAGVAFLGVAVCVSGDF